MRRAVHIYTGKPAAESGRGTRFVVEAKARAAEHPALSKFETTTTPKRPGKYPGFFAGRGSSTRAGEKPLKQPDQHVGEMRRFAYANVNLIRARAGAKLFGHQTIPSSEHEGEDVRDCLDKFEDAVVLRFVFHCLSPCFVCYL